VDAQTAQVLVLAVVKAAVLADVNLLALGIASQLAPVLALVLVKVDVLELHQNLHRLLINKK